MVNTPSTSGKRYQIEPVRPHTMEFFQALFREYFSRDLEMTLTEVEFSSLFDSMAGQAQKGTVRFELLFVDERPIGFVIYQIDSPASDWCEREGWGLIREIYVDKDSRGQGWGRRLAEHAEVQMLSRGARGLYLTSDEAEAFWKHLGYRMSGAQAKNELEIMVKTLEDCVSAPPE